MDRVEDTRRVDAHDADAAALFVCERVALPPVRHGDDVLAEVVAVRAPEQVAEAGHERMFYSSGTSTDRIGAGAAARQRGVSPIAIQAPLGADHGLPPQAVGAVPRAAGAAHPLVRTLRPQCFRLVN
jgi:hypothetical protein